LDILIKSIRISMRAIVMTDYLNSKFDWNNPETVSAFDEISLWSATAGLLLLDHLPIVHPKRVLDIGSGSGFPLLELAERLGPNTTVVGIDTSQTALNRARQKAQVRNISNIEIIRADAAALPFANNEFDLIVSNLGINNFADRHAAFRECHRVASPGALVALTTNLVGHMHQFYDVFRQTLSELDLKSLIPTLENHTAHRATVDDVHSLFTQTGFHPGQSKTIEASFRYTDGSAFLRHSFIRAAFLPAWTEITKDHDTKAIFARLEQNLNAYARTNGELHLTVPFAYIQARKPA
jgi:ubiquinone/menaquinone biosynthesis C-methylase UbiE